MTQGAPKNTRTTVAKKVAVEPEPGRRNLRPRRVARPSADLTGRRLMKLGGEWFEFDRAATSDQLISLQRSSGAEKGHDDRAR
jgi:hypothetical protein